MSAIVLNGTTTSGSFTWTNTTGGNVRLVINYAGLATPDVNSTTYGIRFSVGSIQFISPTAIAVGKTLATFQVISSSSSNTALSNANNLVTISSNASSPVSSAIPTELYIPTSTSFSLTRLTGSQEYSYNILVLPEDG
jgi:hypothetical protein